MKNFFKTFMFVLLLVPCMLGMVACGATDEGGGSNGGNLQWPTKSYIPTNAKYTGGGSIVELKEYASLSEMNIFINNATESDFNNYCTKLENNDWTDKQVVENSATRKLVGYIYTDSTLYTCVSIAYFSSTQERASGKEYNLAIQFQDFNEDDDEDDDEQQTLTSVFNGYNVPTNFHAVWESFIVGTNTTFIKIGDDYYLNVGEYVKTFWKKQSNDTWKQYDYGVTDYDTDPWTYGWEESQGTLTASEVKEALNSLFNGDMISNSSEQVGATASTGNYGTYTQCRKYSISGVTTYLHSNYDICVAEIYEATAVTEEYSTTLTTFNTSITSFASAGITIPQ